MSANDAVQGRGGLDPRIVRQAADWLTVLMADEVSARDREDWMRWRCAHADHERAWQHLERWRDSFSHAAQASRAVPVRELLSRVPSRGRRNAVKTLSVAMIAGSAGWLGWRSPAGQALRADYRTGTGECVEWQLPDGTACIQHDLCAVDVRFDGAFRCVVLRAGRVYIRTAAQEDPLHRPFVVDSAQGRVQTLGTVFTVAESDELTRVAVHSGAVALQPAQAGHSMLRIQAGESGQMDRRQARQLAAVRSAEDDLAWTRGQILADGLRLADFLADLQRYRPGLIVCHPAIADLRLSGVFPVADTDKVLAALANSLPVQVRTRTRFWVTVEPRPQNA